jgi:hypothetical protein
MNLYQSPNLPDGCTEDDIARSYGEEPERREREYEEDEDMEPREKHVKHVKRIELYTIEDAVRDTLKEMPTGVKVYGYQIINSARKHLRDHGRVEVPMGQTIMRRYREVCAIYGVEYLKNGKSEYMKRTEKVTA